MGCLPGLSSKLINYRGATIVVIVVSIICGVLVVLCVIVICASWGRVSSKFCHDSCLALSVMKLNFPDVIRKMKLNESACDRRTELSCNG